VRDNTIQVGGGGTAAAFDAILKKADDDSPLTFKPMGKGGLGPSDHESFARKKIPVLFFFSGLHADYHRPTDDADKVNYKGMDEVVAAAQEVVEALATMPRQQYVGTFDTTRSPMMGVGSRGSRVTLGVMPDYGSDESTNGLRITGTTPGSPAQAAGLLDGDVIVQMNDLKIKDIYDLMNFLSQGKPNQQVKIIVNRKGQQVELNATLAERKG
jgi:C-terminal processing protease CtpA/Prc